MGNFEQILLLHSIQPTCTIIVLYTLSGAQPVGMDGNEKKDAMVFIMMSSSQIMVNLCVPNVTDDNVKFQVQFYLKCMRS